jgi:ribosomal protein L37AE/L43A
MATKENPSYNEDLSKYFKCRSCGKEFNDGAYAKRRYTLGIVLKKEDW